MPHFDDDRKQIDLKIMTTAENQQKEIKPMTPVEKFEQLMIAQLLQAHTAQITTLITVVANQQTVINGLVAEVADLRNQVV